MLLNSNIVFSREGTITYTFDCVVDIRIKKNWEEITSTAEISIPNRFRKKNEWVIYNFKRGDKVIISLGYLYRLGTVFKDSTREVFRGYISSVRNGDVIHLKCEDKMYLLKQRNIDKYNKNNITLTTLLDDLLEKIDYTDIEYEINTKTENIGSYRISNSNMSEVLLKLRKLGLFARFEGEILKIDTPYDITLTEAEKAAKTKDFKWQYNIMEGSSLDFRQVTDIDIVIKGISIKEDNTKITLYAYYDSTGVIRASTTQHQGSQITYSVYNKTETELKNIIKQLLPTVNYSGYYGGFKTFGLPYIEPGYFVRLYDDKYPERNNTDDNPQRYVVKSTETEFGKDGFFQNIGLGLRS